MHVTYNLTSKSQITVPKAVRKHLGLKPGGKATFNIKSDGEVTIKRPSTIEEIRARVGPPAGDQPLSKHEKAVILQISEK